MPTLSLPVTEWNTGQNQSRPRIGPGGPRLKKFTVKLSVPLACHLQCTPVRKLPGPWGLGLVKLVYLVLVFLTFRNVKKITGLCIKVSETELKVHF